MPKGMVKGVMNELRRSRRGRGLPMGRRKPVPREGVEAVAQWSSLAGVQNSAAYEIPCLAKTGAEGGQLTATSATFGRGSVPARSPDRAFAPGPSAT